MGRFLIFFSYLGTRYRGLQTQTKKIVKGKPILTVQDALMDALKNLKPSNDIRLTLSSRTDKGVHAFKNSCHVDLQYPSEGEEYNPEVITNVLNHYLKRNEEDVRVVETIQVHDNFHCRLHAQRRRYVYRLGHRLKKFSTEFYDTGPLIEQNTLPVGFSSDEAFLEELKKYSFRSLRGRHIRPPFGDMCTPLDDSKMFITRDQLDIDKLLRAAELLSGIHNYTAFTSQSRMDGTAHPMKMVTIGVRRGQPLGTRLQRDFSPHLDGYEFWDIHVQARSFLYRMVRRLVGTMVLHARGIISEDDIHDILENPRNDYSFSNINCISEAGLFLQDVQYDINDYLNPPTRLPNSPEDGEVNNCDYKQDRETILLTKSVHDGDNEEGKEHPLHETEIQKNPSR